MLMKLNSLSTKTKICVSILRTCQPKKKKPTTKKNTSTKPPHMKGFS
jgi:hypothetical protein